MHVFSRLKLTSRVGILGFRSAMRRQWMWIELKLQFLCDREFCISWRFIFVIHKNGKETVVNEKLYPSLSTAKNPV